MAGMWVLGVFLVLLNADLGYTIGSFNCDFEKDQCGYLFDSPSSFKWEWTQSPTHATLQPFTDHTVKRRGEGWFMMTKGGFDATGTTTMMSQTKMDTSAHCLSFYVFQDGDWLSTFFVKMGTENLMVKSGDNQEAAKAHQVWQRVEVDIPKRSSPAALSFVVTKNQVGYSVVAIDDITVTKGACKPDAGPSCTFERGQCGWKHWEAFYFQKDTSIPNSKFKTFDHTLATKYGHFMLANGGGKNVGQTGSLISPVLTISGPVCVRFFYILFGDGSSEVSVSRYKNGAGFRGWTITNPKMGVWYRAEVDFDNVKTYQVQINYYSKTGSGDKYMALDDISIVQGGCPERMSVDFESGLLDPWTNVLSQLQWSVVQAGQNSYYPTKDVTLNQKNKGHFAFVMGSQKGYKAIMRSNFRGSSSSSCMSFYVYAAGSDPGTINVTLYGYHTTKSVWSWTPNRNERNKFVRAEFSHNFPSYFETYIQVEMGNDGRWAIDHIVTFSSPVCEDLPLTSNGRTAPPTTFPKTASTAPVPADGYYDCTFDKDLCRWKNVGDWGNKWKLTHGSRFPLSQPGFDHTHGSLIGQFAHIGTGYGNYNNEFVLESPEIPVQDSDKYGSKGCLSFWYYIWSPSGSKTQLRVLKIYNNKLVGVFSTMDQTQTWTKANIEVEKNSNMKFHFEGITKSSRDDISIDDIVYTKTPCKNDQVMNGCAFESSDLCGFVQDKKDNFDWQFHKGSVKPVFADHTTHSKFGHVALMEAGTQKVGDVATLISPPMKPMEGCLVFWLYGSRNARDLKVSTKVSRKKTILAKHVDRVGNWVKVEVPLRADKTFSLVFSGIVTSSEHSDNYLALDDVKILHDDCETKGACSYEISGLCTWYSSKSTDISGRVIRAMDVKGQIHPKKDHTLQLAIGHFLFFDARPHGPGAKGIYESSVFAKNNIQCLQFALSNAEMAFSVYVVDFSGTESLVFRTYDSNMDWNNIAITVGSKIDKYVIRFVAEVRHASNGGVAVDDITFSPYRCDGSSTDQIETTPMPKTQPTTERERLTWPTVNVPTSKFDCSFESNYFCNWKPGSSASKTWLRVAGSSLNIVDHTTYSVNGHVLMVPKYGHVGDKITLTSPDIPSGKRCLIFYVKASMEGGQKMTVFKTLTNLMVPLYYSSHWPSTDWQRVEVPLASSTKFKIVIQTVKQTSVLGYIYIDDIAVPSGDCPKDQLNFQDVRCNFEDGNRECSFTQDTTDDYDWDLSSPSMKLPKNVPRVEDHTLQTESGHFLLAQLGTGKPSQAKARIISPRYVVEKNSKHCLSFFYHMNGLNIGHLNVYIAPDGKQTHLIDSMRKWSHHFDGGKDWQKAFVQIQQTGSYHVVFEAVKSSTDYIYGIDDIQIVHGVCPTTDQCSFEDGTCLWHYMGFLLAKPIQDKKNMYSMPPNDHTLSSPNGHFFYLPITSQDVNIGGRLYDIVRDPVNVTSCFTFWYHMYGNDDGSLRVLVNDASTNATPSIYTEALLWELSGSTGDDKWHLAQVPLTSVYTAEHFQIIIEADSGKAPRDGDVSIDDTAFKPHKCQIHPDTANPIKYVPKQVDCNFDKGNSCNWKSTTDKFGRVPFTLTDQDPSDLSIADHTSDFSGGNFLLLSSMANTKGTTGVLTSPIIPPTEGTSCLAFFYVLDPDGDGKIRLLMKTGTSSKVHWAANTGKMYSWNYAFLNLHSNYEFQLIIEATAGNSKFGSIAFDDIKMTPGPCHQRGECSFGSDKCGFHADKNSDFDWKRVDTLASNFPLPEKTPDGNFQGHYLASEFKNQKAGDKAIVRSKLYTPSEGECLTLFVASGFNADMDANIKAIKGNFTIKLVPEESDGSDGDPQILYTMVITGEQWWKEIHFNVISKTHYRLIFEADVIDPSGYVVIDDLLFSTSPCPSDLACDFEGKDNCGYENIAAIDWHRVKAGLLRGQFKAYEHDHTTGTQNGHYLLYQFDAAAQAGVQEARVSSNLQPRHKNGQCLTLWFAGFGAATFGIGTATAAGVTHTLLEKKISFKHHSVYQDYAWDYLRVDLPANEEFFLDIWVTSKIPNTAVAVDDIKVQSGTCEDIDKKKTEQKKKKPYYDPTKKIMGCTYDAGAKCPSTSKNWTIVNAVHSGKHQPFMDHTSGTIYGHYLHASSRDTGSGRIQIAELSATSKTCIDFYLFMYGDESTAFTIYVDNSTDLERYFVREGDYSQKGWMHESVEIGGKFHNHRVVFEANFGKHDKGYVAVDDVFIYRQPCKPKRECQFEDDGWCGFQQGVANRHDWVIQQADDYDALAGPLQDHTLQSGQGHYAMFEPSQMSSNERSSLVTPMYDAKDAQCLQFFYTDSTDDGDSLKVYVRDQSGKDSLLLSGYGRPTNWNKALLPINSENAEKFQFVFMANAKQTYDGGISIDDVKVMGNPCHELVNCDFTTESDMCGWQNYNQNPISWRQDKPADGVSLSIPAVRSSSFLSRHTSILQSQIIPVFQVADYCLSIKYSITGKVVHSLGVYVQEAKNNREYLQMTQQAGVKSMSGILYVPSKTTLYADEIKIRIKAFYGNEKSAGKVNIYNVQLHNSPCSEVEDMVNDAFKCQSNQTHIIDSKKVCDFSRDCSDGSDEQQCGNCTFETGYCDWLDLSSGETNFVRTSNFSIAGHLNSHAHYMLLKNGDEDSHQDGDFVFSKPLGPSPPGCSVTFDYYTESFNRGTYSNIRYPIDDGTLNVVIDISGDQTVVWKNPRGSSQDWHSARVDIGHIRHRFKLRFQAEHYSYTRTVIAIDNIKLAGCQFPDKKQICNKKTEFACKSGGCITLDRVCDLEVDCVDGSDEDTCKPHIVSEFEYGFVYWTQATDDDFDWVRLEGKSPDQVSGANRDHTLGTNKGHYLSIEGNGHHKKGDKARLLGPTLQPTTSTEKCVMTVYTHRSRGLGDGTLNVLLATTRVGPRQTVGTVLVDDISGWKKNEFILKSTKVFQVVLEGVAGGYHSADIDIDDVFFSSACKQTTIEPQPLPKGVAPTVKPSVCKAGQFTCASGKVLCLDMTERCNWSPQCDDGSDERGCGPCSFDSGMCGWHDVSDGRIMFNALNGSQATGVEPRKDHTNKTSNGGTYMRIVPGYGDSSLPARLVGPTLRETSVSCRFGVYFYKMGPTSGQITIGVQNPAYIYRGHNIISQLPFQSLHYATWLQISAQFGKLPAGYQPFVEITSSSVNDDIAVAIDDVFFTDCEPNKVFNISGATCDFENGMCEWFNDNLKGEQWVRTDQTSPMANTGPDRDHTTGSGFYIYATSPDRDIGADGIVTAHLRSALLQWPNGEKKGCLSFWYLLYGVYVEGFEVFVEKDQNTTNEIPVFSKSKSQGNVWKQGFATIEASGTFQLRFRARIPNFYGDVALDDIKLSTEACPAIPECDFELGMCGFQSKSKAWKAVSTSFNNNYLATDHTLQTRNGHYLALDPTNLPVNDKQTLISPIYPKTASKMCLTIFIYKPMSGASATVYVKNPKSGIQSKNGVKIFDVKTHLYWTFTQHTFSPEDDYQIILEGYTPMTSLKPIAFDDFRIDAGECPVPGSCDFEKSDCGYFANLRKGTNPSWVRNSGFYLNENTGPPVDHTTKTAEGFYMVADSFIVSEYHDLLGSSEKFSLISQPLPPTKSKHMCFSFWYYMNGNTQDMSTFKVIIDSSAPLNVLFTESKSMGERWNYQAFNITSQTQYTLKFEADIGSKGKSDVAIDDILITDGDCTQRAKAVLKPEVPQSYPPTKFDCSFDQGNPCNWTMGQAENGTFKIVQRSSFIYVSEPFDHTHENSQGKFLEFLPTGNISLSKVMYDRQRTKAVITSPSLDHQNTLNGTCLKFWYFMKENSHGFIGLKLQSGPDQEDVLWRKFSDVQTIWKYAQIHTGPAYYASKTHTDLKFVIEFYALASGTSEYRIDDISLNEGPCLDNLKHCDFEEDDICGFVQDRTESLDWIRFPRATPFLFSPSGDHTYGSRFGHFMYLYTAGVTSQNAIGRILSPTIDATSGKCLRFFFYMSATFSRSKLQVKLLSEEENEKLLWEQDGENGSRWNVAAVSLDFPTPSKIVFEGWPGGYRHAYIGVDDLSILGYECPLPATCDFERDLCLFSNNANGDDFNWQRHMGPTSSSGTGANVDATTHTKFGHYLYIESSAPRVSGDRALLVSQTLSPTRGSCLTFSYHMHGYSIGSLKVMQMKSVDSKDSTQLLASLNGEQGPHWKQMSVNVTSQYSFYFEFLGEVGTMMGGDIAIDDISYTDSPCTKAQESTYNCTDGTTIDRSQVCDFVPQCSDRGDEAFCGDCNFENNMCGYASFDSKHASFRRGSPAQIDNVDFEKDHTLGTKYGHVAYVTGHTSTSTTPVLLKSALLQKAYQTCRIEFFYKLMYNRAGFQVELEFADSSRVPIYSATQSYNYGSWMQGVAQIGYISEPFRVVFSALKTITSIPFAIDDITLKDCGPPATTTHYSDKTLFTCQNGHQIQKKDVCDLADDCGDGSDELKCSNITACDFEKSMCAWKVEKGSKGSWVRSEGMSPSYGAGPLRDHTTGTPSGHFIYLQHYYLSQKTSARVISPVVEGVKEGEKCWLTVYYQMRGLTSLTTLSIYIQTKRNGYTTSLFTKHNVQQNYWDRVIVALTSKSNFQVIIEGTHVGYLSHSEIGVDDIVFSSGCHMSASSITLPTPSSPLTTVTTPPNKCFYVDEYQCGNGTCIHKNMVCDFVKDCDDGSDEFKCGSCDFEKGLCGWYEASTGRIGLARSTLSTNGKFGPANDTTTKSSNGHYLYATLSSGITDSPAVLKSGPLRPISNNCYMTLYIYTDATSNLGTLQFAAFNKDHSIPLSTYDVNQYYTGWHEMNVYFPSQTASELSDGWHLEISYNYPEEFSPPDNGMFALDDIQLHSCSSRSQVPNLNCNFDFDLCTWAQSKKDIFDWKRAEAPATLIGPIKYGWDREILIAKSQGQRYNDMAIIESPQLPPNTDSHCLMFDYYLFGSRSAIDVLIRTKMYHYAIFRRLASGHPKWQTAYVSISSNNPHFLEINAIVSGDKGDDIAIDNVRYIKSSCEKEQGAKCTFDDVNSMCGWANPKGRSIQWNVRNSLTETQGMSLPKTDHTTLTKYGYFAYVPVNQGNAGQTAVLSSPSIEVHSSSYYVFRVEKCFTFWYHMFGGKSPKIEVYLNSSASVKKIATFPGPTENFWRRGSVTVELEKTGIILLSAGGQGGFGHIAIDDTNMHSGRCNTPGTCDFDMNLCGYINSPNNAFNFVLKRRGYGYNYAIAKPSENNKKGDTAVLISDPILKQGCLYFAAFANSDSDAQGIVNQVLNVYVRELASPQNKTLVKTMQYFARNAMTPDMKVDVSSFHNFEILFEVVHNGLSGVAISLEFVRLESAQCSSSPINTTTVAPSIAPVHPPSPFDCHFKDNTCGWTILSKGAAEWNLYKDGTKAQYFEDFTIWYDHTLSSSNGGFLESEVYTGDSKSKYSYVVSPQVDTKGSMCFQFWYYMFGPYAGELKLVLNTKPTLWSRVGPQGPQWNFGSVHIRNEKKVVLSFEAGGTSSSSGSAIDDISAFYGKCPETNGCDFENGVCNYGVQQYGYANWTIKSGVSLEASISPLKGDHTVRTFAGSVLALDPKIMTFQNGRFFTTTFAPKTVSCLTFWYYMKGFNQPSLTVQKVAGVYQSKQLVFSIEGPQGPSWQLGTIDIEEPSSFQLLFNGYIAGKDKDAFIAVDDIQLVDGKCPRFATCDFEDNICDWTNAENKDEDDSDWSLFRGDLLTSMSTDHTTGTIHGGYLITTSTEGRAVLVSPTFEHNSYYCLTLWAALARNTLTVVTRDIDGNSLPLIDSDHHIAKDPSPKTNGWKQYQFPISSSTKQFRVFIEGHISDKRILLDDIAVSNQKCSNTTSLLQRHQQFYCSTSKTWLSISKKCDFKVDCLGDNEEISCGYNCTFENANKTCKWKNNLKDGSAPGKWKVGSGASLKSVVQTVVDETYRSVNGHFLYNFNSPTVPYQSPLLQESAASCEIKFSYFRYDKKASRYFVVRKIQRDKEATLMSFEDSDYTQPQWQDLILPLGRNDAPFYVQIELQGAHADDVSIHPDILIDDIAFRNCALPPKASSCQGATQYTCRNSACVDKAVQCNLQDDCGDRSDETEALCTEYHSTGFEDGSLKFWQQEIGTDEFDWHVKRTYHFADHTLRSADGHVASAENSYNQRKTTDRAHIVSFAISASDACRFSVSYMMEFASKGEFKIYKRYQINGDLHLIATPEPGGKYVWSTYSKSIFEYKPYQIVLEMKGGGGTPIYIDDTIFDDGCSKYPGTFPKIAYTPPPPPTPAACTFKDFACHSGGCIPKSQKCDFILQCQDGSDEKHCSSCDFDETACTWLDFSKGSLKWKRTVTSPSLSVKEDHTKSSSQFHGFMHVVQNRYIETARPAVLKTEAIGATNPNCVLVFWVYVKNAASAELRVNSETGQYYEKQKRLLDSFPLRDISQGSWTKLESNVGYMKYGGGISISATSSGVNSGSVIAIDDVSYVNCSMGVAKDKCESNEMQCGNKVCISTNEQCDGHNDCADDTDEQNCFSHKRCDFDGGYMCDFITDPSSTTNWTAMANNALSSDLLPPIGHSFGSRDQFLAMKPSGKPRFARLKTPVIFTGINPVIPCQISFFYYQQTKVSHSVNVYTQYFEDGPLTLMWSNKDGTNGIWMKARIPLTGRRPLRVVIEGVAGKNTAVAIDDVWYSLGCEMSYYDETLPLSSSGKRQGSCKTGYFQCDNNRCLPNIYACDRKVQCTDKTDEANCGVPCNFENGVCGWTAQSQNKYNLTSLDVGNFNVSADVNPGTNQGHVISDRKQKYGTTVFKSPFYHTSYGNCLFSFWHTAIKSASSVQVEMHGDVLDSEVSGTAKGKWVKQSVQLPQCASKFQLTIKTSSYGTSYQPVIFDDFKWENCPMDQYQSQCKAGEFLCKDNLKCISNANKCDLSQDCCDGSDEDPYLCYSYRQISFDWGMDKWEQEKDDEGDWSLSSTSYRYNEIIDHTSGAYNDIGQYVLFESSHTGYKAKMSYAATSPLSDCRMRLWYAGNGHNTDTSGTLTVYMQIKATSLIKLRSVTPTTEWQKLVVPIQTTQDYKIVLEAVEGLEYPSDVFVDDITFTPGCSLGSNTPPPTVATQTIATRPPVVTPSSHTVATLTGKTTHPTTARPACPKQFQCLNTKKCFPLSTRCDFNYDCLDKTDEDGCYTRSVCDFTKNMCGWTSSSVKDGLAWVRDTPSGAKQGQAPSFDASFHRGSAGHFVYLLDNVKNQASEYSANMNSRIYNGAAASCIVQFSYFTQGSSDSLRMFIQWSGKKDLIWKPQPLSVSTWQKAMVSIGRRKGPFSLEFVKSTSGKEITAIDNIKFTMCAEPPVADSCKPADRKFFCSNKACIDNVHKCDGQDDCGDGSDESTTACSASTINNFNSGFNNMRQLHHHDTLDWKIWSSTSDPATGLQGIDHTTFTSRGQYAYAVGTKPGDSAWLLSSNWVASNPGTAHCKGTLYVMAPTSDGTLTIGTISHHNGKVDKWMPVVKPTGSTWSLVDIVITDDKPFLLVFKAEFTKAGSAVAIDDIIMSPSCKRYNKPLPNMVCPQSKFECHTDLACIDRTKVCDGTKDCKDGTDESRCSTTPSSTVVSGSSQKAQQSVSSSSNTTPSSTVVSGPSQKAQQSVSSSSSSSWKTPVGVVLGLVGVVAIVIVVVVFLKKKQHLTWLRLPNMRTNILSRNNGMENPLYEYGTGGSSNSDFQLDDMSAKNPDDIFGESTKPDSDNSAFDNPLYVDDSGATEA